MALSKETIEFRKTNNLCPKCGKPNAKNRRMCEKHLKQESVRSNRNQKRRRKEKEAKGVCNICGEKSPINGRTRCQTCIENSNERISISRLHRQKQGLCTDCGKNKLRDGRTTCISCRKANTNRVKILREKRTDKGLCVQCGERSSVNGYKKCPMCLDAQNEWYSQSDYRDRHAQIRNEDRQNVMDHYGGKCICCGESEILFLTIDHIYGGGNQHRKDIKKWGSGFYKWLIKENFPNDFQLLCHNCNMGKHRNGGICPHIKQKT